MTATEQFYLKCLKSGIEGKNVDEIPDGIDYKRLVELSTKHAVIVLLYYALKDKMGKLPETIADIIKKSFSKHAMLDTRSAFDKQVVFDAFEKNKIKFVPLKGYFLKQMYLSPEMRYTSDSDILIEKENSERADKILTELNYRFYDKTDKHNIYYNPVTKTVMEIHVGLFGEKFSKKLDLSVKDAKAVEGYEYFYKFTAEDFYLSYMAHNALHFYEGAGIGIRALCDIKVFRDKNTDLNEEYLDKRFSGCGLLKFKNAFEKATRVVFDGEKSDEFTDKLLTYMFDSRMLSNDNKVQANIVAKESCDFENGKKMVLFRKFFPKKEVIYEKYGFIGKCRILLPIGYLLKWVQGLKYMKSSINGIKQLKGVDDKTVSEIQYFIRELDIADIEK